MQLNRGCTEALGVFRVWIPTHMCTNTKVLYLIQAATGSWWRECRAWESLERLMTRQSVEF